MTITGDREGGPADQMQRGSDRLVRLATRRAVAAEIDRATDRVIAQVQQEARSAARAARRHPR